MEITRYDGTRFITEEEIDRDFTDKWVLISIKKDIDQEGYLVASAPGEGGAEAYTALSNIAMFEYDANAKIRYGCRERGFMPRVQLLD